MLLVQASGSLYRTTKLSCLMQTALKVEFESSVSSKFIGNVHESRKVYAVKAVGSLSRKSEKSHAFDSIRRLQSYITSRCIPQAHLLTFYNKKKLPTRLKYPDKGTFRKERSSNQAN